MISSNGKVGVIIHSIACCNECCTKRRSMLNVLHPDEEEKEYDHDALECEKIDEKELNACMKS